MFLGRDPSPPGPAPQVIYWAWRHIVLNIPLASSAQLRQTVPSQLLVKNNSILAKHRTLLFRAQQFFIKYIGILSNIWSRGPTFTCAMDKTRGWLSKTEIHTGTCTGFLFEYKHTEALRLHVNIPFFIALQCVLLLTLNSWDTWISLYNCM